MAGIPGIYIAAVITTLLALGIIGTALRSRTANELRGVVWLALLLELPMCAVAFYYVRLPLDRVVKPWLAPEHLDLYRFLTVFYAPLTEEPAKLWPLLLPWIHRRLDAGSALRVAVALGLGFGIGELWFIAERLARNSDLAKLPWYQLGGFLNERFMVCVMHGVFTSIALTRFHRGVGPFLVGVLGAMAVHFVGNFAIYLAAIDFGGFGKATWQTILALYVPGYFVLMLLLLARLAKGLRPDVPHVNEAGGVRVEPKGGSLLGDLLGRATCPECSVEYDRPIWALNLPTRRYERCPSCRKWHWVKN